LAEERAFPKEQAYKDLKNVVEYIVKKFFKAARENPFLLVEVGLKIISTGSDSYRSNRLSSRRIEVDGKHSLVGNQKRVKKLEERGRRAKNKM
jgi:hypothetical protein